MLSWSNTGAMALHGPHLQGFVTKEKLEEEIKFRKEDEEVDRREDQVEIEKFAEV